MRTTKSDVAGIILTYKGMNQTQLEKEADEISNLIYALLVVTESKSIEVEFDREVVVEMKMNKINQVTH